MNKEDYSKYYIQGSDHYLIPKYEFIELFNEMENWREEAKELNQKYLNAVADYETTMSELQELKADYGNKAQVERDLLLEENKELKKQLEEKENIACSWKDSCIENAGKIEKLENQQKEFIKYLENEKDRLARECSQIYEDDLGKTRLVNEDIFNEVNKILSKYKSIIGVSNE